MLAGLSFCIRKEERLAPSLKLCSNLHTRAYLDVVGGVTAAVVDAAPWDAGQSCSDTQVDVGSAGPYLVAHTATESMRPEQLQSPRSPTILLLSPGSLGTLMSSFLPLPLFGICAFF